MTSLSVAVIEANLAEPRHQRDVVAMTAAYAREAMGVALTQDSAG